METQGDKPPILATIQALAHDTYDIEVNTYPDRTGWQSVKCPFHDDRSASGSINYAFQSYVCFACPAKGDSYSLIMQQKGLSFRDAAEWAADNVGFARKRVSKPARKPFKPRRPPLLSGGPWHN